MPDGTEIGRAYITVNLDDQTTSDYERIRADLGRQGDVTIKAKVETDDKDPIAPIREKAKSSAPVEVPTVAKNPIDAAWRSQVEASLKSVSADSLKIPMTPDTAEYRSQVASTVAALQKQLKQDIPADLAEADRFKASVETLVRVTQEEVQLHVPVDVDADPAKQAFKDLADNAEREGDRVKASSTNSARTSMLAYAAMFAGMPAVAAAAGVGVAAGLASVDGALLTVGVAALKSNQQVSDAWRALGANLKSEAQSWAQPLAQPFVQSAGQIEATAQQLSPQIRQMFANAAPAVAVLTGAVTDFATRAMPGLVTASASAVAPLQGIRSAADSAGTGMTAFFRNLSTGAQGSQQILSTTGRIIQDFEGFAGQLFANLANNGNPALQGFRTALQQAEQTLLTLTQSGSAVYGFFNGVSSSLTGMIGVVRAASSVLALLPSQVTGLAGSFTAVAAVASKLGVDVRSSFSGIKTAISDADGAGAKLKAGITGLAQGAISPATLAVAGLSAVLMIYGQREQDAAAQAASHASRVQDLAQALLESNGAIDANVQKTAVMALQDFNAGDGKRNLLGDVQNLVGDQGIPLLTQAYLGNADAANQLKSQIQGVIEQHSKQASALDIAQAPLKKNIEIMNGTTVVLDQTGMAARQFLDIVNSEGGTFAQGAAGANQMSIALGGLASSQDNAAGATANAEKALQAQLAVANAQGTISDRLQQANQQAAQAAQSVASAQHSLAQSGEAVVNAQHGVEQAQIGVANANQAVANAEHGVEQAQQSLTQAYQGVATAQQAYVRSQQAELQAEKDLDAARKQAIQDLKDLHLQLADQVVSEGQARVSLYDAQVKAAGLGVDASNAEAVSHETVTAANEDRIKAALDLLAAQNQVNDSLNQGAKLRDQVTQADQAGVEGSTVVVNAQKALVSAQEQVTSSAQAVTQAQQQVSDAQWNVQQSDIALKAAHQGVTDAAWSLRQAQLGVTDASWAQHQAAQQLSNAQYQLRQANDATSTSMDINTAAGRQNLTQLLNLWDAIQKQGGPVQDQYRALVDQTAASFGISRDRAQEYLEKLGLIPKDFQYSVTAIGEADVSGLKAVWQGAVAGVNAGRGGWNFAEGGYTGDGGKYEPAGIVHKGEWVVPQEQVHAGTMPILQGINAGKVRGGDGASLPGYASGGLVAGAQVEYGMSEMGTAYQGAVNVLDVMGMPHPPGLPKYVPPPPPAAGGGGMISYNGGAGVAQWAGVILQALAMLGQDPGWLGTVERRMNQESGGNPNVVNQWDSNWVAGHPSVGLMQVIAGTYARWKGPDVGPYEYGVSVDPLSNVYAGLNYAIHNYGSLSALNRPGGYDSGGYVFPGITPVVNATGKPEMMLPPKMGDTLEAIHQAVQGGGVGGSAPVIHVHVNQMAADPYETAQVAARELAWQLRR